MDSACSEPLRGLVQAEYSFFGLAGPAQAFGYLDKCPLSRQGRATSCLFSMWCTRSKNDVLLQCDCVLSRPVLCWSGETGILGPFVTGVTFRTLYCTKTPGAVALPTQLLLAIVWLHFRPWVADVTIDYVSGASAPLRKPLNRAEREQARDFVYADCTPHTAGITQML